MNTIFITGCSRGLGKSLLDNFLLTNNNIIPHFRRKEDPNYTHKNEIIGDLTHEKTLQTIENFANKTKITHFINNAAVYLNRSILNISIEKIKEMIDVNIISQILLTQILYNHFKETGGGIIFNISSLTCKHPGLNESIYTATKFAMDGFYKSLQLEALKHNIYIINVYIGAMQTRMCHDRENYNNLITPDEVSKIIIDAVNNKTHSYTSEIVIRRKL